MGKDLPDDHYSHRPTGGKQSNKKHCKKGPQGSKNSKKSLKKTVVLTKGGAAAAAGINKKHRKGMRQAAVKENKKIHFKANHLGSDPSRDPPPRNILLLPLHESVLPHMLSLKQRLVRLWQEDASDDVELSQCSYGPVGVTLPAWSGILRLTNGNKKGTRLMITEGPQLLQLPTEDESAFFRRNLVANLDAAKIADMVIFVMNDAPGTKECLNTGNAMVDWQDSVFDPKGYELLSALRAQGLMNCIGVRFNENSTDSMKTELMKSRNTKRYFTTEFGEEAKFFDLSCPATREREWISEARKVTTSIVEMVPKFYPWRNLRGYMMANGLAYELDENDSQTGKMTIMGYARGVGFSTKQPVHLTGHGNYFLNKIIELEEVIPRHAKRGDTTSTRFHHMATKSGAGVPMAIPSQPFQVNDRMALHSNLDLGECKSVELQNFFNLPDIADPVQYRKDFLNPLCEDHSALDGQLGEQTWPLEDDIMNTGWDNEEEALLQRSDSSDEPEMMGSDDRSDNDSFEDLNDHELRNKLFAGLTGAPRENDSDESIEGDELREREAEEMDHPDEEDTPIHMSAEEAYRDYRDLNKGFRHSYWDPHLNLPANYGRIYDFENYDYAMRYGFHLMRCDAAFGIDGDMTNQESRTSGKFIAMEIADVSRETYESIVQSMQSMSWSPLLASSMSQFETKCTLLHSTMTRRPEVGEEPIISNGMEGVEIQAGFQRRMIKYVMSEDMRLITNCKKSLVRKYLGTAKSLIASFFGPCLMPGTNILYLMNHNVLRAKVTDQDALEPVVAPYTETPLFANGIVQQGDAKRMLIKRSILSGYPHKIHKNSATIRYMFHRASDVRFFSPVELETLTGKRGHITEPVGEKGRFKAFFEEPVHSGDVIALKLYKRVFPDWPEEFGEINPFE